MKKFFVFALLTLCGMVAFAKGGAPNAAVFTLCKAEFKVVENGGSNGGRIVKSKSGEFRGQNFYFEAKGSEWEERKMVLLPSADAKISFTLRAPNGAVAEFKSFKIDGEEKLTEPLVQPYSKKQPQIVFSGDMKKDKEMVVTFQIRRSDKTPADFLKK